MAEALRLFYAVPFDPGVTRALEAAAREALGDAGGPGGDWRVTPAANVHLTLRFLGDTPADRVPALEEGLRAAAAGAAPFRVEVGGWHLLPGPRDPRVLAVGLSDPTGTLPRLASFLEERAVAFGYAPEGRGFLAHATVARRKGGRRPGRGRRPGPRSGGAVTLRSSSSGTGCLATQTVGRIALLASALRPEGPVYTVVAEAGLGPPGR
jgi:2'-5' RNA ligase